MTLTYTDFSLLAVFVGTLQFLLSIWIKYRLEKSIKHEYDKILEKYRWDLRLKDRIGIVAEYLSITMTERMDQNAKIDRVRANQLAWEIAIWLPDNLYLELKEALNPTSKDENKNVFNVLIKIRNFLREEKSLITKEKSRLTDEDIFFNKPPEK